MMPTICPEGMLRPHPLTAKLLPKRRLTPSSLSMRSDPLLWWAKGYPARVTERCRLRYDPMTVDKARKTTAPNESGAGNR